MSESTDWNGLRGLFPSLHTVNYLNSCSLGLLSTRSRAAVERYLDLWQEKGAASWYSDWMAEIDQLRSEFARLINAEPDEIAAMPSISAALTAVSSSLDLSEGDQIITSELDFPTVAHHFHAMARHGVETTLVSSGNRISVDLDRFTESVSDRTRLVASSRVYFTSGYIQDIASIADIAHQAGALCFIDDYQATGQVPIDVKADDVDFLASGGLKWLLGGPGISYLYVRRELISEMEPSVAGWFGHQRQFDFDPTGIEFKDTAARFETGTPSVAAVYAGAEGLRLVNEIGADAIRERTSSLANLLTQRLREKGFRLRAPEDSDRHASITMIEIDDPVAAVDELSERDIIVDVRPGAVRVSPYFYNSEQDIESFVDALVDITRW